jgi:hypothetical protein
MYGAFGATANRQWQINLQPGLTWLALESNA